MIKTKEEIDQILGTEDSEILNGIRAVRNQEANHAERYNPFNVLKENKLFSKLFNEFLEEKNPLTDLLRNAEKK